MKPGRWWWLGAVAVIAAVVRAVQAKGALLYPDGYQYVLMARGIAEHGRPIVVLGDGGDTWVPSADAAVKPFFPAVVAVVHLLGLPLVVGARVVTAAAATAVCVLTAAVAARLAASRTAGVVAGALCVASPELGHWTGFSGPDSLAQALALAALLAYLDERPALAGALAGLCVATRPELAVLALPACLLSRRFAIAGTSALALVVAAVRPPLAFASAMAGGAALHPVGARAVLDHDWPILGVAALGLASAPRGRRWGLVVAALLLGAVYAVKDPGSERYFALLIPLAALAAGFVVLRRGGIALAAAAVVALSVVPRLPGPPPDAFRTVAAKLPGSGVLYTAAPDAYAVLSDRPIRFLRSDSRGLIVLDAAARTYERRLRVTGRVVRRIAVPWGFVRPDGTIDDRAAIVMEGTAAG